MEKDGIIFTAHKKDISYRVFFQKMSPILTKHYTHKVEKKYFSPEIFRPPIFFQEENGFSLHAYTGSGAYLIYDGVDIVDSKVSLKRSNFKGLIGERILSVVLEELVKSAVKDALSKNPEKEATGKVLRAVDSNNRVMVQNDKYLLLHKGNINFVIQQKIKDITNPESDYAAVTISEIDGLAYLHCDSARYLLVGEAKTVRSWKNTSPSEFYGRVSEGIVPPLKSLFPDYELIFVFVGNENINFTGNILKPVPRHLTEKLEEQKVKTLFIPLPPTPKTLDEYAEQMYHALQKDRER